MLVSQQKIEAAQCFDLFFCFPERAHIVGRGCSTKDKVFYRECETHSYGANLEKMCFCSFELCNQGAPGASPPLPLPPISSMVRLNSLVSASGFLCALLVSPGHSLTRLWHHLAEGSVFFLCSHETHEE